MRTRLLSLFAAAISFAALVVLAGPASAVPGITPGAFCAKGDAGRIGFSADGDASVCSSDGQRYRWRAAGGSGDSGGGSGSGSDGSGDPGGVDVPGDVPAPTESPTVQPAPQAPAKCASTITLNASPEPLKAGSLVTLSGYAGCRSSGNAGTVRLSFRKYGGTAYALITQTRALSSGTFKVQTKQTTSGYWKATYLGNTTRGAVESSDDYVEARAWRYVRV